MSDCFDHALDAFDSWSFDLHQDQQTYQKGETYFDYDPLFYHRKHKVELIHETELAYNFKSSKGVFLVAKSLCKKFKPKKGTVLIWYKAKLNYNRQ